MGSRLMMSAYGIFTSAVSHCVAFVRREPKCGKNKREFTFYLCLRKLYDAYFVRRLRFASSSFWRHPFWPPSHSWPPSDAHAAPSSLTREVFFERKTSCNLEANKLQAPRFYIVVGRSIDGAEKCPRAETVQNSFLARRATKGCAAEKDYRNILPTIMC